MAYYSANLKYLGDAVKQTKVDWQFDGKTNLDSSQTGVTSGLAAATLDAGVAKAYGTKPTATVASAVKGVFYTDWSYGITPLASQNQAGLNI